MTIEEILALPDEDAIKALKAKTVNIPKWSKLQEDYNPLKHEIITNAELRPKDKKSKNGTIDRVAKITYAAERNTVRRMVQMAFTTPVARKYKHDLGEKGDQMANAIEKIYVANRINGVNVNRFRAYFAACEVCTIWYAVETETMHEDYGFPTKFKFRCRSYSPMDANLSKISQAELYPCFDQFDDMIAMSIEYIRSENGKDVTYFETYTATQVIVWRTGEDGTERLPSKDVPIGKIQVAYINRPAPIFDGVANNRGEIEFALSRESDIIRKNSSPIIKITGKLLNDNDRPEPDTAREVYQLDTGGDISTVSPTISPESTELLIDQLKENIEEETQLPNLALTNIKDLGNIGEGARKTLLSDAHMKVGEEKHEIIWFLERECSIIKAFTGVANKTWENDIKTLSVTHDITPFVMNDDMSKTEKLTKETGAGLKSRLTAIKQLGDVEDPQAELNQIQAEAKADAQNTAVTDVFATAQ